MVADFTTRTMFGYRNAMNHVDGGRFYNQAKRLITINARMLDLSICNEYRYDISSSFRVLMSWIWTRDLEVVPLASSQQDT